MIKAHCFYFNLAKGSLKKIKDLLEISPSNPKVILEDTVIELKIAKMLVKRGCRVRFVLRTGKKGGDFDLQVTLPSERVYTLKLNVKEKTP